MTVPLVFGKVMVRSSVGSSRDKTVSFSSSEVPSSIIGVSPARTPVEDAVIPVKLEPSPLNDVADMAPVVERFSSPKDIAPSESVIEPSAKVKFPIVDPVANIATPVFNVPEVERFSSPKDIAPSESVIEPSVRVKLPIEEPDSKVVVPAVNRPVVVKSELPKDIEPSEFVIELLSKVKLPIDDPLAKLVVPAVKVPVVVKASLPKEI